VGVILTSLWQNQNSTTTDAQAGATRPPKSSCSSASRGSKAGGAACPGWSRTSAIAIDVLTQISAIQAALDKISLGLLDDHARHCMQGKSGAPSDPEEQVDELMGAVARLLHH